MPGKYSVRNDTLCPAYGAAAFIALLLTTAAHSDTTNVAAKSARATNDFPVGAEVWPHKVPPLHLRRDHS